MIRIYPDIESWSPNKRLLALILTMFVICLMVFVAQHELRCLKEDVEEMEILDETRAYYQKVDTLGQGVNLTTEQYLRVARTTSKVQSEDFEWKNDTDVDNSTQGPDEHRAEPVPIQMKGLSRLGLALMISLFMIVNVYVGRSLYASCKAYMSRIRSEQK